MDEKKELYDKICAVLDKFNAEYDTTHDKRIYFIHEFYHTLDEIKAKWSTITGDIERRLTVKDIFSKEFYDKYGDVDVYNDVTDDAFCAFCGGLTLTEYGEQYFADALGIEITAEGNPYNCIMLKLDKYGDDWERYFDNANELFNCAAGYCPCDEYGRLFKEQED